MKTDKLEFTQSPKTMEDALDKIELIALYAGMSRIESSSMRLLAEEMMSAIKGILDAFDGKFWMETQKGEFSLHFSIERPLHAEDRKKLIALSKSGKATPPKGLFSRLGAALERLMLADDAQIDASILTDYAMFTDGYNAMNNNPLQLYTYHYMPDPSAPKQQMHEVPKDELEGIEKKIIDAIVDDVTVVVETNTIEIVAIKKDKAKK